MTVARVIILACVWGWTPESAAVVAVRLRRQRPSAVAASTRVTQSVGGRLRATVLASYVPANYSKAKDIADEYLHQQVFNTSKEIKGSLETGKARREVWNEEQRILHAKQEKRLKNISDCINAEEKKELKRKEVCQKTRDANEKEGSEQVEEPAECEPGPNIFELCDQPRIPVNLTQGDFGNEIMEVVHMHTELEAGLAQWVDRSHAEEISILNEVRNYYTRGRILDGFKDLESAKKYGLKEVKRMEGVFQDLLEARERTWVVDKTWYWAWGDQAQKTALELCAGNITSLCRSKKVRIVKEAEEDTVKTADSAIYRHDNKSADNSPWSEPYIREFLEYLPNETMDIATSAWPYNRSWWKGSTLPTWSWDERRANDLAVMDGLETILQTGERYFDYMRTNLLGHLGTRKSQLTELRIQAALREVGLIPTDPDLSGIELRQKEIELMHRMSQVERTYHFEEQSRLWGLVPFLDSAIRDINGPDEAYVWCQKTSLRWYKCRQTLRQLLDYLQDTVQFLNVAAKPLRDIRNEISYRYDPLYHMKEWVAEPVDETNARLERMYHTWDALNKAESLARGDGDSAALAKMRSAVRSELQKAHQYFEQLVGKAPQWSREYQIRQTERIVDLMDKKNDHVEYLFYGGGSEMANRNRNTYKRMSSPNLWLLNVTGLGVVRPPYMGFLRSPLDIRASEERDAARYLAVPEGSPAPVVPPAMAGHATARDADLSRWRHGGLSSIMELLREPSLGSEARSSSVA